MSVEESSREGSYRFDTPERVEVAYDLAAPAIRNLLRAVDYLPWSYALGAVVMFLDARSRRLGDMAAGTLVVKERRTLSPGALGLDPAIASAAPDDGERPLPDLRRLT